MISTATNKTSLSIIPDDCMLEIYSYSDKKDYSTIRQLSTAFRNWTDSDEAINATTGSLGTELKIYRLFTSKINITPTYQYGIEPPLNLYSNQPYYTPKILNHHLLNLPNNSSPSLTAEFIDLTKTDAKPKQITFSHKIESCQVSQFPKPCFIIANQALGVRILPLELLKESNSINVNELDAISIPTPENPLMLAETDEGLYFSPAPVISLQGRFLSVAYKEHIEIIDLSLNSSRKIPFNGAKKLSFHKTGELIAIKDYESAIIDPKNVNLPAESYKIEPMNQWVTTRESEFGSAIICGSKLVCTYQRRYRPNNYNEDVVGRIYDRETKDITKLKESSKNHITHDVTNQIVYINDSTFMTKSAHTTKLCKIKNEMISNHSDVETEVLNKDKDIYTLTKIKNYVMTSSRMNLLLESIDKSTPSQPISLDTLEGVEKPFVSIKVEDSYLSVESSKSTIKDPEQGWITVPEKRVLSIYDLNRRS